MLALYGASRLYGVLIIGRVARFQVAGPWTPAAPDYGGFLSMWDGDWYRQIAESGYPPTLPLDAAGQVQQNPWAFYPLYPMTVRTLMRQLGTGWAWTASSVSLVCAGLAVLLMYDLVRRAVGHQLALWTVALFVFFPAAPILQLAYTESMGALVLVSVLWCLQRRRYLLGIPLVGLVGLCRPIGLPLAVVVGVHLLQRLLLHRREPLRAGPGAALLALTAAAGGSGLEWPYLAGRVTGIPDAYTQSMAAWRTGHHLTPFTPWLTNSRYFLGTWVGPAALILVAGSLAWALTRPAARLIAGDLRTWVVAYLGYLAAVLDPATSLFRYLLLLFPLGTLTVAASPSRAYRLAVLAAFAAGQVIWVTWLWRFTPPSDWPP